MTNSLWRFTRPPILRTAAGCSSTAATRWCPRTRTASPMFMSTSRPGWEAAHRSPRRSTNELGGCVDLISSGQSSAESTFLDASENGDDVFFLTAAQLAAKTTTTPTTSMTRMCAAQRRRAGPSRWLLPNARAAMRARRRPRPSRPSYVPPASETFNGAGNVPRNRSRLPDAKG